MGTRLPNHTVSTDAVRHYRYVFAASVLRNVYKQVMQISPYLSTLAATNVSYYCPHSMIQLAAKLLFRNVYFVTVVCSQKLRSPAGL